MSKLTRWLPVLLVLVGWRAESAPRLDGSLELGQGVTDASLYLPQDRRVPERFDRLGVAAGLTWEEPRGTLAARGGFGVARRSESGDTVLGWARAEAGLRPTRTTSLAASYQGAWGNDRSTVVSGGPISTMEPQRYVSFQHLLTLGGSTRADPVWEVSARATAAARQEFSTPDPSVPLRDYGAGTMEVSARRAWAPNLSSSLAWRGGVYLMERDPTTWFQAWEIGARWGPARAWGLEVALGGLAAVDRVVSPVAWTWVGRCGVRLAIPRGSVTVGLVRDLALDATVAGTVASNHLRFGLERRLGHRLTLAASLDATGSAPLLHDRRGYLGYVASASLTWRPWEMMAFAFEGERTFVLPEEGSTLLANHAFDSDSLELTARTTW